MMRWTAGAVTPALLAAAAALGAPASAWAQGIDVVPVQLRRLVLDLTIAYEDGTLRGTAQLTLRNAGVGPVARIALQVHRLMDIGEVRGEGDAPLQVTQDVVRYVDAPQQQVTQAWVTLNRPLAVGDSVTVRVGWHGFLWGYTETGSRYIRDHVDSAFTILREDALAFPSVRVPSWRANRAAPGGAFDFEARVTVPRGQIVGAGGTLVERVEGDRGTTWVYRSTIPVPFLNIVIAPYGVLAQGGVRVHYFPADSAGARMVMDAITRAVAKLTDWFGPLGRDFQLSVMEIPDGYGSQADLGAGIIQQAAAFRDRSELAQLYHELSHLWNAPDADTPSPRWNEGLATFLEHKLARDLDGQPDLANYAQRVMDWFVPRLERDTTNIGVPLIAFGTAGKTDLSYTVGFFLFYALHEVLGPEAFNRAVGGWYQTRRGTGGTTDEFVRFVKASTAVSLDRLFDDWVYTARWYERVKARASVADLVASYRSR